jgi:hypothetical protein
MHRLAKTQMANSYQPMQSLESEKLRYDLFYMPNEYERSAIQIFGIGYGRTVETGDEPTDQGS